MAFLLAPPSGDKLSAFRLSIGKVLRIIKSWCFFHPVQLEHLTLLSTFVLEDYQKRIYTSDSAKVSLVFPINCAIYHCQSVETFTQHSAFMAFASYCTESYLPPARQDLPAATHSCHRVSSSIHSLSSSPSFLSITVRSILI